MKLTWNDDFGGPHANIPINKGHHELVNTFWIYTLNSVGEFTQTHSSLLTDDAQGCSQTPFKMAGIQTAFSAVHLT